MILPKLSTIVQKKQQKVNKKLEKGKKVQILQLSKQAIFQSIKKNLYSITKMRPNKPKQPTTIFTQLSQNEQFQQSIQQSQTLSQLNKIGKAQQLLIKIIHLQDPQTGNRLIQKFSIIHLIKILDKNKLQAIDKIYNMKPQGFNLLEFIRFFLNAIEHLQSQTLYLTIGLVDLFKAIAQVNNSIDKIKFIHLTDFICNMILHNNDETNITGGSNSYSENKIDMKLLPQHKYITPNYEIKPYIIDPPKIYGNKDQVVYKLSQSNIKTDKNKHDSVVTCSFFSNSYKKVFSLDALAQAISIYDVNCKLQRKLKPQNLKIKKDVVLLSFAYSERQERIGAVLKDFTLSFWDFNDNLQFQKVISTASSCQQYQTNIWYLQYFQAWITSDKIGIIYIWNLQKQLPQRKIECKFKGKINDICEIPCLNLIAVAQQSRNNRLDITMNSKQSDEAKIILYDYFRGQQVGEISSLTDMRIPHTLQYSQSYQVLLSAGFEKKINIFEINHQYLDTNLKGELLGHQSLITHFILVKKTPMVVSCDDKGKVKIWDLRSYKCIQTLDFRDKTVITRLLDMVEIGKMGVLGSRINFLQYDQRQQIVKKYQTHEKNIPLNINFIYETNKLLITTKKDLRVYNMHTGRVQKVYCQYHNKDQQIVIFKYYELMKKLLITNDKGEIRLVSLGGGMMSGCGGEGMEQGENRQSLEQRLQGYSNGIVTHVQYDQQNKLFLTCGGNGTINIHKLMINNNNNSIKNNINDNNDQDNPPIIEEEQKPFTLSKKPSIPKYQTNKNTNPKSKSKQIKPIKNQQWIIIRQMKGNFFNKDITIMAFSVYHGMIAIGFNCSQVYVWDYQYAKILFAIQLPQGVQPTAMSFINGFSILLVAGSNGELYFIKLLRLNQYQFQQKLTNTAKLVTPQNILTFKDNRVIYKNDKQKTIKLTNQQDPNDYITQIIVEISMKGTHKKSQIIQFGKLYMSYNSGKIAIMQLSQLLKKHPILPHRKTLATYNPQRQLKEQFAIELQKQKTLNITLRQLQEKDINKRIFIYPYEFLKPHSGAINSMKILQFDKHYLITCGNDQRIKIWNDIQFSQKLNNNNRMNNINQHPISNIELLGDFNINHPLPYLWNFIVKDEKKIRDKIMFSLKIIQSIFKKFGSDISTGESKILKLQSFFRSLKNDNKMNDLSEYSQQLNYLTQPIDDEFVIQKHKQKTTIKPYLFQQQFTKKDLHYQQIKKYNFYEVGGPSLRELQFRKKIDTMQKQWQVAKQKQEEQKNQLMSKIQYKAQKNEQKQQIISFLQDRRLVKNASANNINTNKINMNISNINTNNNNSNIPNINNINQRQDQQYPVVKRITQELKRIQTQQHLDKNNKDIHNSTSMNSSVFKMHKHSYTTFIGKFPSGNNNSSLSGMKMSSSIMNNNNNKKVDNKKDQQQKVDENYGQLLRKYYSQSKSAKSLNNNNNNNNKTINPKGFEQYYYKNKKLPSYSKFQQQQKQSQQQNFKQQQRLNMIPTSQSKSASTLSLINSRSISHQSLHKKGINMNKNNKTKHKFNNNEHLSFQNILKDMNNRVLLSRQGRTVAPMARNNDSNRQEGRLSEMSDNERVFQYPTERNKRTKRLAKTQYSTQFFDDRNKIN